MPETRSGEVSDPVSLLSRLIQFDTSNFGNGRSNGERACAEWVVEQLRSAGWSPLLLHRDDSPDRSSVVLRVPGADPGLEALIVHAHLDVVPVEPEQWNRDPFSGEIADGYVHGRGAVDMKDTVASLLHTLLVWGVSGVRPRRDVIAVFVADEEDAGLWGADWLVEAHPELFVDAGCAIGESGGMGQLVSRADGEQVRLYPIFCGERGSFHIRLTATGASGHGSRPTGDDAVATLVRVCHQISTHQWPLVMGGLVEEQFRAMAAAVGVDHFDPAREDDRQRLFDVLGPEVAGPMPWTIRPTSTVTMLQAGYKVNVIPGRATAEVDVRCPPGAEELVVSTLTELIGDQLEWEFTTKSPPLSSPTSGPWYEAMAGVLTGHDPEAVVVPGCMGGGTDAKAFARLGLLSYGFTPAPISSDGLVGGGMHGVDEKVPVTQVEGAAVWLRDFLETV